MQMRWCLCSGETPVVHRPLTTAPASPKAVFQTPVAKRNRKTAELTSKRRASKYGKMGVTRFWGSLQWAGCCLRASCGSSWLPFSFSLWPWPSLWPPCSKKRPDQLSIKTQRRQFPVLVCLVLGHTENLTIFLIVSWPIVSLFSSTFCSRLLRGQFH